MTSRLTSNSQGQGSTRRRVLVTGGAGFVGSHLCERLLCEGFEVIALDNLLTGRLQNIHHLMREPRFGFVQASVTNPIEIEGPLDYVMSLASPASPRDYTQHPLETLEAGSLGTRNALKLAESKGAVFLVASSSEVYGDPEVNPQPESYWGHVNSIGPRSMYDESKRYAEAITAAYARTCGLRVRIARIFNTYGPRMRVGDGRVVPNFIDQALNNRPLTVYGDGSQTRSLCYVDDLVDGLYRLLLYEGEGIVGIAPEPVVVNLGNPDEVTILELAHEIIEMTGSCSEIVFQPLPTDDPKLRKPDIARARNLLRWEPKVSRREGLKRVIAQFNSLASHDGD